MFCFINFEVYISGSFSSDCRAIYFREWNRFGLYVFLVSPQFLSNVCRHFQWRGEANLRDVLRVLP